MIRLVTFSFFVACLAFGGFNESYSQVQSEKKTNTSNTVLKPQRLQDLEGNIQSARREMWEEMTREFNKCLPTKIGSYTPYDDDESYIQSGTMAADPATGIAFFKSYRNSESSQASKVIVSIIANSPMVSSLASFLTNPMIAKDTGKQSTTYGGFKAIEEYDPVYRTGEINLLLSDNTLVTISATDIPDGRLLSEFAKSINYKRILAIIE
jgi:hypothetical protein